MGLTNARESVKNKAQKKLDELDLEMTKDQSNGEIVIRVFYKNGISQSFEESRSKRHKL